MTATTSASTVTTHDPPSLHPPEAPVYSHITLAPLLSTSSLFTFSGQVAIDRSGKIPSDLPSQIDLCLSKISTCLESIEADIPDITKLVYYFVEDAYDPETTVPLVVEKLVPWLKGHKPASCMFIIKALSSKDYLCEFEATGVVSK